MRRRSQLVRSRSRRELELVLMVRAKDPKALLSLVAGLSSIRGYELRAGPDRTIHDVYFDTSQRLLTRKNMNLRIRHEGGDYWITWKRGSGLLGFWRRKERREVELPWSGNSLSTVFGELRRVGVGTRKTMSFRLGDPIETMKSAGMVVLQNRETSRRVRGVISAGSDRVLAELAIDTVVYHFEHQDVRLDELELEAKAGEGATVVEDVIRGLMELLGGEVRPWRWGKLFTGEMIERMLRDGCLRDSLDGAQITPKAVERVEAALSSQRD